LGKLTTEQEKIIMDLLGKLVIHNVRDGALKTSMRIVTLETKNFEHIEAIKKELIDKGFTIK